MSYPPPPRKIVLTGRREHAAIAVMVDGFEVHLGCAPLELLLELVLARAESESGYVDANPTSICRLRRALDAASSAALIETGVGQEYRLTISRQRLAAAITLTPCFFELVDRGVVTKDQADRLRQHFRVVENRSPLPLGEGPGVRAEGV